MKEKISKFVISNSLTSYRWICLIDGGYTCQKIMKYVSSSIYNGFIGRYSKGRNIFIDGMTIKLKDYMKKLSVNDFDRILIDGVYKYVKEIECDVIGLSKARLVLVIDNVITPQLKDIRPLVTNIFDIKIEEVVDFYSKRWKQETYHQVIKEPFGSRTHKLRKLKTFSRYLEILAISYTLLEVRRIKFYKDESVFQVRNDLVQLAKKCFILNLKGNKIPKSAQNKLLKKFAA